MRLPLTGRLLFLLCWNQRKTILVLLSTSKKTQSSGSSMCMKSCRIPKLCQTSNGFKAKESPWIYILQIVWTVFSQRRVSNKASPDWLKLNIWECGQIRRQSIMEWKRVVTCTKTSITPRLREFNSILKYIFWMVSICVLK